MICEVAIPSFTLNVICRVNLTWREIRQGEGKHPATLIRVAMSPTISGIQSHRFPSAMQNASYAAYPDSLSVHQPLTNTPHHFPPFPFFFFFCAPTPPPPAATLAPGVGVSDLLPAFSSTTTPPCVNPAALALPFRPLGR